MSLHTPVRLQDQGTVQRLLVSFPRPAVPGLQLPGGRAHHESRAWEDAEVRLSPRSDCPRCRAGPGPDQGRPDGRPHGLGPWMARRVVACDVTCVTRALCMLRSCLLPPPSCSVGKHGRRPRNATSASYEHPRVPRANDFRDFVLEMQNTITDLRKQVPWPRPFPRVRTDSCLWEREGVRPAAPWDPGALVCSLLSWLGHTEPPVSQRLGPSAVAATVGGCRRAGRSGHGGPG